MTQDSSKIAWQTVAHLLRQTDAGMTSVFPQTTRQLSLLDALGHPEVAATEKTASAGKQLGQQIQGLLSQLQLFDSIGRCPILAIAGILNAGKSSLLATYLSPENRPRILRGLGNQSGTHRFVLWLPKIWWDDPDLLNTLIGFMASLFGHAPERLSDDPQTAALQYNGQVLLESLMHADESSTSAGATSDPLSIPLIAYDALLDELRIGLLDCPDIQTGFMVGSLSVGKSNGLQLAADRQEQLSRIGRLCSAFVVVTKMNSLHDDGLLQILTTLRDAMPGVPRLLAINKIKARYAPETVYDEARGLVERFGIGGVFGAYDFRSALAHSRIPAPPDKMPLPHEELPIFWEMQVQTQPGERQYLFDLGRRLDAGALSKASSRSLVLQLRAHTNQALEWLESNQSERLQQIRDAWQAIADACYEFMAERDASGHAIGLRLQASPAIVAQMADSLQRTAPMWMRVSLTLDRTARQFQQAISNSAARLKILRSASETVTQFAQKFRRGEGVQVVTPKRLSDMIRSFDKQDAFNAVGAESLLSSCDVAMQRFANENKTLLDQSELDTWSRQVWNDMSWRDKLWKGTQPLAIVTAPLLAVVLLPFDGGGSAVLVFASAKELLAAAGLAAILGPATMGGEALSIVHRETPWRQLSDLFAIGCDSLGLPRPKPADLPNCGGPSRRLLESTLQVKPSSSAPAIRQWEINTAQLRELRRQLQQQVVN